MQPPSDHTLQVLLGAASDGSVGNSSLALSLPKTTGSKRSRKSKESIADIDEDYTPRKKTLITHAMKVHAATAGRVCGCCRETDRGLDPVNPEERRQWAYYRKNVQTGTLMTEGGTCWYCFRVWRVKFQMTMTLGQLKTKMGNTHSMHEEFQKWLRWLIQRVTDLMEDGLGRDTLPKVHWPTEWQLKQMDIFQVVWTLPSDQYMDYDAYILKHGEPSASQLSTAPDGKKIVKLHTEKIYKRERQLIHRAQRERTIDDGSDSLAAEFGQERFHDMVQSMDGVRLGGAAGSAGEGNAGAGPASAGGLTASSASASASSSRATTTQAACASAPLKVKAEEGLFGSCGVGFASVKSDLHGGMFGREGIWRTRPCNTFGVRVVS